MRQQPRKHLLLETAYGLFNRQGYHATGIDQILAESGVAKATLYKYFPSKEDLILAVLERRHQELEAHLEACLAAWDGPDKVLALFEAHHAWFHSADFQGCNYIHASAEYADPNHPIHRYAAWHKTWLKDLLETELSKGRPQADAARLASQLMLLLDGATVAAQVRGELDAARQARAVAEALLAS